MDSETTPESTPTTSSLPSPVNTNNKVINFRELKKELKDIEKLSKEHLDIKSWASELKLWIKLQNVRDPQTIFTACILTSTGEVREVIQNLEDQDNDSEDENEEEDDEEDSNNPYPSLAKVVDELERFYGTKEDQNVLLRELRALKIKRNEKVKDFNIRYRSLYLKLDKKRRKKIGVLDYADSLQNNKEAWKRVSLKDNLSLRKAFEIAEKVDRLIPKFNSEYNEISTYSNNHKSYPKKKISHEPRKPKKDDGMEDLTKKMKNLTINACFFCKEEGHYQQDCPKLKAIIDENRKSIFEAKRLNH